MFFDHTACSTMDETRTKKGEVIAYALELCGRECGDRNTLMVGDRFHDIVGAKDNGLSSIGVSYGYGSYDELRYFGADRIARSVRELSEMLLC